MQYCVTLLHNYNIILDVRVVALSLTSVLLSWTSTSPLTCSPFNISIVSTNDSFSLCHCDASTVNFTVRGLLPKLSYSISVDSIANNTVSPKSTEVNITLDGRAKIL